MPAALQSLMGRPPIVVVSADANNDPAVKTDEASSGPGRSTHIEVCVRLRPIAVGNASSNSFFESSRKKPHNASTRKPQLPGSASASSSRLAPPSASRGGGNSKDFYAWDVASDGSHTIAQSPLTDIVNGRTHQYTLDGVYGPESSTQGVYDASVKGLVRAALEGYHASVLAYGQTSTGKTHTMTGTVTHPGIVPLAVRDCFSYIQNQPHGQNREYLLRLSYLEVYKEHIRDLLQPSVAAPPVRLYETSGPGGGMVIRNVQEEVVTSPEQVFALLRKGEARRQIGATSLNQHSSRSHVLVRLWMESRPRQLGNSSSSSTTLSSMSTETSCNNKQSSGVRISSLSLVDLAGSESVRLMGSSDRQQEGHYINQSLMTLGKVVYALSEQKQTGLSTKKQQHIPYRDSKLTRLLQPSLSGNAQVVLICCVSPLANHIEESHNTLKFALRAKKIPQRATIHEAKDEKTLLFSYREEIELLKRQLTEAREDQERLLQRSSKNNDNNNNNSNVSFNSSMTEMGVDEDEISELVKSIRTMEKLILKSNEQPPEDLLDGSDYDAIDVNDTMDDEEDLMALAEKESHHHSAVDPSATSAPRTPTRAPPPPPPPRTPTRDSSTDRDLQTELSRVKGLLGSVMKKRANANAGAASRTGSIDAAATAASSAASEEEMRNLREQLERQQVASSLRKADSSFLQKQLEAKDQLLLEVSNILEALEARQLQLEAENTTLRRELVRCQSAQTS